MKKDKLKNYSVRFAIAFFIAIALLTYFSDTIDTMLLPKVKTTEVISGALDDSNNPNESKYLIPLSAVSGFGDNASIYYLEKYNDNGDYKVYSENIEITNQDEMYCEVTANNLYGGMQIVYSTSKSISSGDRVYVEEE